MAVPVEFRQFTPRDSREDLIRRVEAAPAEHAEAVLAAYDLLQRMHEKGLIDVANGLLSASDTVVDRLTDVVSSKQAVNALRALLMVSNLMAELDVDALHEVLAEEKAPSLWEISKRARGEDARRGLAAAVGVMAVVGKGLKGRV